MTMSKASIVYGEERYSLVFLPEKRAREVAADLDAICGFTTHGEARAFTPKHMWAPGLENDEGGEYPDDEPYDAGQTAEVGEGDWPVLAATMATEDLPGEIQDLCEREWGFLSDPTLRVDPANEQQVVAAIRELGYDVHRDDALFSRLDPYFP
jgi:hypothetical protein